MAIIMDLVPTLAKLANTKIPDDRKLDGFDILPLLTTSNAKSPYKFFRCYGRDGKLAAIRESAWKLQLLEPIERYWNCSKIKKYGKVV